MCFESSRIALLIKCKPLSDTKSVLLIDNTQCQMVEKILQPRAVRLLLITDVPFKVCKAKGMDWGRLFSCEDDIAVVAQAEALIG